MCSFCHTHQDPGSRVWDILQSLDALAGDPNETCFELTETKARISFTVSERRSAGQSLAIFGEERRFLQRFSQVKFYATIKVVTLHESL